MHLHEGSEGNYRWLSVTGHQKHGPTFLHHILQRSTFRNKKQEEKKKKFGKVMIRDLNTKNQIIAHIVAVLSLPLI
jgi:hypothetical protein